MLRFDKVIAGHYDHFISCNPIIQNETRMKRTNLIAVFFCLTSFSLVAQPFTLLSPDARTEVTFFTEGQLQWAVKQDGKSILLPSRLSLTVRGKVLGDNPKVVSKSERQVNETLVPVVAQKTSSIADRFNELKVDFKGGYSVVLRAYDDGVAYRFETRLGREIDVETETVEMNFPDKTYSWFPEEESMQSHYERIYLPTQLDTLGTDRFCSLPVLMDMQGVKVLLTEADLYDYPGMFMFGNGTGGLRGDFPKHVLEVSATVGSEDRNETITKEADYIARTSGNRSFPWRLLVVGNDQTLLETNLVYQLSRPGNLQHTEWIQPGKVAWDWYNANNIYGVDFQSGLNTETYMYYIDFASRYGLEYIILDEGWSKSTTEILAANPDIDLPALIAYGNEKKVGIILWTLWKPIDLDYKNILATYAKWGIKGVKIDFMQRTDQYMVNYFERIAAEGAKNKLLVDFHGAFKPSGLRRAYPNLISYEGVKGNENNKWSRDISPEHNVTLPFTRMVAGPMDFTPGALVNAQQANYQIDFFRPMALGTRSHQLAMYVVFESPLQMLCELPTLYYQEPEITQFIAQMPTTWDETRALDCKVGDYVSVARRKGDKWYVGAMTDWTARTLTLDFSFLSDGKWELTFVADGANAAKQAQDYKMAKQTVDAQTKLTVKLAPGGGWTGVLRRSE